jgi:hypothetical protein
MSRRSVYSAGTSFAICSRKHLYDVSVSCLSISYCLHKNLEGEIYDREGPDVVEKIQDFIKTYEVNMKEVLIPKPSDYKTFNQFFSRKLKPGARKIDSPKDASVIVSAADCRLSVFADFTTARRFW